MTRVEKTLIGLFPNYLFVFSEDILSIWIDIIRIVYIRSFNYCYKIVIPSTEPAKYKQIQDCDLIRDLIDLLKK
ncbi:hypothetical protein DVR14_24525 (plasmid) [Natrinema thermotolerans]|nr:hypothetical protein DVR14_24525 [Natrinema thermotolerans]